MTGHHTPGSRTVPKGASCNVAALVGLQLEVLVEGEAGGGEGAAAEGARWRRAVVRKANAETQANLLRYEDAEGGKEWLDMRERSYRVLPAAAEAAAAVAAEAEEGIQGRGAEARGSCQICGREPLASA